MEVILTQNEVIFDNFYTEKQIFPLTDKESTELYGKFLDFVRELDYHRKFYDYEAPVYITKVKINNGYNCNVDKFTVHDTVNDQKFEMFNEDEAITLVKMLRGKYRE